MPTCQQTMSVTVRGPFTIGTHLVTFVDVLPPAGFGAPAGLAAYWASIAAISSSV